MFEARTVRVDIEPVARAAVVSQNPRQLPHD
jgi:hypothetical protein